MKIVNIATIKTLIAELEKLYQPNKSYIFRGQPDSNFYLAPKAFRIDMIKKLSKAFPAFDRQAWINSNEIKGIITLYLNATYINSAWVRRICALTIYIMQYNYSLSTYVQQHQTKFDHATIEMYKLHPPSFWIEEKTFLYLFRDQLMLSIGRIALDGKILNYSVISEDVSGYEETLPQHYGVPTTALDWTYNMYVAFYFALQNIPNNASHFSIYAYKEINGDKNNPIAIEFGHPDCCNSRIIRQEGLFTRIRYAFLYYFTHGIWPNIETYISLSKGNFNLIKYNVPISQVKYLNHLLDKKGITKDYLLPEPTKSDGLIYMH